MSALATLQAGESGVIRAIHSEQALYYRLAVMGFRIGKRIQVVRSARFGVLGLTHHALHFPDNSSIMRIRCA